MNTRKKRGDVHLPSFLVNYQTSERLRRINVGVNDVESYEQSWPIWSTLLQLEGIRRRWADWSHQFEKLHHLAPVFAVIGLCLSMLHQSSLGATYGIMKSRPTGYRPDMAVLFIVSAMAAGPAMNLLASKLAGVFSKKAVINEKADGWNCLLHRLGTGRVS